MPNEPKTEGRRIHHCHYSQPVTANESKGLTNKAVSKLNPPPPQRHTKVMDDNEKSIEILDSQFRINSRLPPTSNVFFLHWECARRQI